MGPVAGDREAVLPKAVCGRGELPAGGVNTVVCCRERELPGPQSVQARVAQQCVFPQGWQVGVRGSQKAVLAMLAGAKIRGRLSRVSSSRR